MKSKEIKENIGNVFSKEEKKSLLTKLIFCGKNTKVVNVQDFVFTLKTLSEKENRKVVEVLLKAPENERLSYVRAVTLAFSIDEINEIPFLEVVKEKAGDAFENDEDFILRTKIEIVLCLQNNVVTKIFEGYESLIKDTKESLDEKEIKN